MSADKLLGLGRGRRKPNVRPKNERDFPYIVELPLPPNGFDERVRRAMEIFHRTRDIRPCFGSSRRRNEECYCRWCFSDPVIADAFRERFGGMLVTNKPQAG